MVDVLQGQVGRECDGMDMLVRGVLFNITTIDVRMARDYGQSMRASCKQLIWGRKSVEADVKRSSGSGDSKSAQCSSFGSSLHGVQGCCSFRHLVGGWNCLKTANCTASPC